MVWYALLFYKCKRLKKLRKTNMIIHFEPTYSPHFLSTNKPNQRLFSRLFQTTQQTIYKDTHTEKFKHRSM